MELSVTTRAVGYTSEGRSTVGHLALPGGSDPRPAVLIAHEGAGLNDFQRNRADQLAARGFAAFAMDYHAGRWYSDPAERMAQLGPVLADPDRMRDIGIAALEALLREPRVDASKVAVIGYGAGGSIAMEVGRAGVPLRAIAAVNPVLSAGRLADSERITCPLLVSLGSKDPLSPPELRASFAEEMDRAHVDWQMLVHGGAEHVFHMPPLLNDGSVAGPDDDIAVTPGVSYSPRNAERSWAAILELLDEVFGEEAALRKSSPRSDGCPY